MATQMVDVSYQAREQFAGLSKTERTDLTRLLTEGATPAYTARARETGGFISRFGENKRVLWKKSDNGKIVDLSIVAT